MEETVNIEISINKTIDIDVRIDEIIDGINYLDMKKRWNYIAQILNGIKPNLSELTDEQKELVRKYLLSKLELFNPQPMQSKTYKKHQTEMTFIREVTKNTGVPTLHYEFKCNGKLVTITKTAFDREGWEEVKL